MKTIKLILFFLITLSLNVMGQSDQSVNANYENSTAIIDLDLIDYDEIKYVIQKLDKPEDGKSPIKNYVLKGNFRKLGIVGGANDNPFRDADNAESIDFTQITPDSWPKVKIKIDGEDCFEKGFPNNSFNLGGPQDKGYKKLRKIVAPKEVEILGKYCFRKCKVKELFFPGVKYLGDRCFNACSVTELWLTTPEDFKVFKDNNGNESVFVAFTGKGKTLYLNENKQGKVSGNTIFNISNWGFIKYEK